MAIFGLKLDHILDDVLTTVSHILGDDIGLELDDLAPGKLIETLGGSLDGVLTGGSTDLFDSLKANGLIDFNLLNDLLNGSAKGPLDLGSLGDLLSGDTGGLKDVLDDIFDDGLLGLGDTTLDLDELLDLNGLDLGNVTTFVTNLVVIILKATGDLIDIDDFMDDQFSQDDLLKGDGKDNFLDGRGGDDTIRAFGGADTLIGGDGFDVLKGGIGGDRLNGGADVDLLFGGRGGDTFIFTNESDFGVGAGNRDVIKDFGRHDEISFRGFDLDVIGRSSFSGDGQAELAIKQKSDFALVRIDFDGDGQKDFEIEVSGRQHLDKGDFML